MGALGAEDENAAGRVVHKERGMPQIDVGILIGHYRLQAYRVAARRFFRAQTVGSTRRRQGRQGLPLRLGLLGR